MGFRKIHNLSSLLDGEAPRSVAALEILEPVDGDARGTRGELEQARFLLTVPGPHRLPEELDHLVGFGVAAVVGMLLPVVDIDLGDTADQELELSLVEDVDEILGDELVEALLERLELLGDALLDAPLDHEVDVLLLVLVGHVDVAAAGDEILDRDDAETLIIGGEGLLEDASRDVVVEHPLQGAVEIGIHALHVGEDDRLAQDHLVQGSDEEGVQEAPVEDGKAHHAADEFEVIKMLGVDARVRIDLQGIVVVRRVLEETVERIEHFVGKKEEELARETTVVEAVLAVELDHEALLQIGGGLPGYLSERVLEDVGTPDLDVALAREDAHGGLRPEVDQLPPEVTLVLRHVLVQGGRQARVVPGRRLGVVVDKVDTSRVGEAHLPAAGERAQLGDGLLLDGAVGTVLAAVHADVLLAPGIDPGGGSGVVIDEVGAALGSPPLFPAGRKLAGARGRRARVHHG